MSGDLDKFIAHMLLMGFEPDSKEEKAFTWPSIFNGYRRRGILSPTVYIWTDAVDVRVYTNKMRPQTTVTRRDPGWSYDAIQALEAALEVSDDI